MKRYIRFSTERSRAIQRAEFYSDLIMEHIVKIVVYYEVRGEYVNHWIDEIAGWLSDVDSIKLKTRSKKLKPEDLMSTLFSCMGDELNDYRFELDMFQTRNKRGDFNTETKGKYPEVRTTYELTDELMGVCYRLMRATIPMLCDKDDHSKTEYVAVLKKVFKPYL